MITGKIDVTQIKKEHLFQGKKGKYLDLVIWELKDGPDRYENTHVVCQGLSKEARARGEKGPIIGNLKITDSQPPVPASRPGPHTNGPRKAQTEPPTEEDPDAIPF